MRSPIRKAVWLDHDEARIFHVEADGFDTSHVRAPKHHIHRHPKGGTAEHNHPDDLHRFFHDVAEALHDADQILLLGPSTAKLQFIRYLRDHGTLEPRVVGIETVDHPTDPQLVAHARRYFRLVESGMAPRV